MRVVLDTNVLISALGWKNNPYRILNLGYDNNYVLLISPDLIDEFMGAALRAEKFPFSTTDVDDFISSILEIGELIYTQDKIYVVKDDPDDNKILELAYEGKADYIVTGDEHLLKLKEFKGIKILRPSEFLELF